MAELILLIYCAVVVAIAYWVSRLLNETRQVFIAWIISGIVIAIGLGVYGVSKVSIFKSNWSKHYQIDESL